MYPDWLSLTGEVYGNVVWNEYIRFPLETNKRLYIGRQGSGSTLTIPEGMTAVIPDGATLYNMYNGFGGEGNRRTDQLWNIEHIRGRDTL